MRHGNAIALLACAAWTACGGAPPAPPAPYAPRAVVERARWDVFDGDLLVGRVRQLEIQDPREAVAFYRVEDTQGRWLGHATAQGRFSRRVPFQEQEEDLGVWSLARGVAELLDAKAPVRLQAVPVEADARKR